MWLKYPEGVSALQIHHVFSHLWWKIAVNGYKLRDSLLTWLHTDADLILRPRHFIS